MEPRREGLHRAAAAAHRLYAGWVPVLMIPQQHIVVARGRGALLASRNGMKRVSFSTLITATQTDVTSNGKQKGGSVSNKAMGKGDSPSVARRGCLGVGSMLQRWR